MKSLHALPRVLLMATLLAGCVQMGGAGQPTDPSSSQKRPERASGSLQEILTSLPRQPRIAIVDTMPFHLEIVAGLVDATAPFRNSTTFFLNPAVYPGGMRNLGFLPFIGDVRCETRALSHVCSV
jgi:hypothetical protein